MYNNIMCDFVTLQTKKTSLVEVILSELTIVGYCHTPSDRFCISLKAVLHYE